MKTPDNSPGPGDYNIGHELGKIKEIIPKHTDENTHN